MTRGSLLLSDLPPGEIGLSCAGCARSATYPVAHLVADMGPDAALPDALRELTSLWCRAERRWMDEGCRAAWVGLGRSAGK